MSLPDIFPKKSTAGIVVEPNTLTRIVPESRRPDGSIRKELKIRPGFTPQEDIGRFKSSRQLQREQHALPKGQIIGWAPPEPTGSPNPKLKPSEAGGKSAKKNQKKKEKKEKEKMDLIAASWEDDVPKKPKISKEIEKDDELHAKLDSLKI